MNPVKGTAQLIFEFFMQVFLGFGLLGGSVFLAFLPTYFLASSYELSTFATVLIGLSFFVIILLGTVTFLGFALGKSVLTFLRSKDRFSYLRRFCRNLVAEFRRIRR